MPFNQKSSITKCAFWFKHCVNIYFSLVECSFYSTWLHSTEFNCLYLCFIYFVCFIYYTNKHECHQQLWGLFNYVFSSPDAPWCEMRYIWSATPRETYCLDNCVLQGKHYFVEFKNLANTLEICLGRNHRWNMKKRSVYIQNIYWNLKLYITKTVSIFSVKILKYFYNIAKR